MKKIIFLLLMITASAKSQTVSDAFKRIDDTSLHVYGSMAITMGAAAAINHYTDQPIKSIVIASIISLGAGMGKEVVWDGLLGKGTKDRKDLTSDIWGTLVGAICIGVAFDIKSKKGNKDADYRNK
jgi:hypothetical protein